MRETPNLLLKLPDPTDYVLVEDLNENFTKLDTEIAKITDEETGVEAKLTKHLDDDALIKHKARQISVVNPETQTTQDMQTFAETLFTDVSNGKQLIGTAITDVDDSLAVPTNPTHAQLADLIGSISTGKKWASGAATVSTATSWCVEVTGLAFKPNFIFIWKTNYTTHTAFYNSGINISKYLSVIAPNTTELEVSNQGGYITNNAFKLYVATTTSQAETYNWIAFE